MGIDLDTTRFFIPVNSVVNTKIDVKDAVDNVVPFTYTEWLDRVNLTSNQVNEDFTRQYNAYLRMWRSYFDRLEVKKTKATLQKYKNTLKNIAVNYTTDEQKRFLTTLDYNNPRHVESALSFFAEKLKEVSLYYVQERQNVKQQRNTSGNIGTVDSFKRFVKNVVPKLSRQREIITGDLRSSSNSTEKNRITVSVIELYDIGESNPKTGAFEYDANLYLNYEEAVRQLLVECVPIIDLSSNLGISIGATTSSPTDQDYQHLAFSNFEDYIKDESRLNILNIKEYVPKLLGGDVMYLSGGEVLPLIEATHPWRNIFNRYLPTINNTKNVVYRTKAQIGDLYIPSNLGILTYYSYNPVLTITDDKFVGTVPDPELYGPSAYTGSVHIPISLQGDVTWIKADRSNDRLAGDITVPKHTPKFYSYRSDEEYKNYSRYGISRWQDPVGFFDGPGNREWANPDVFPPKAHNIYNINDRQETVMVTDDTATDWSTDIHGNEYVTMKLIKSTRAPLEYGFGEGEDDEEPEVRCITIDGGETLEPRLEWFETDDPYIIYDGGRHPNIDPKIEQAPRLLSFPDLREMKKYRAEDGTFYEQLEPHNSYYYGPNSDGSEMILKQITYKGFDPSPFFDFQAYCGLFTDEACGVQDPSALDCNALDGYAFGTFSDGTSGVGNSLTYLSLDRQVTEILSSPDTTVNDKLATYSKTYDQFASFYKISKSTENRSTPGETLLIAFDAFDTDSVKSSFSGDVPTAGGSTSNIFIESLSAGRGNDAIIIGDGLTTLTSLVNQHNNNNTVQLDTTTIVGGGVIIQDEHEIHVTGSSYTIITGDTTLTLEDANNNEVSILADSDLPYLDNGAYNINKIDSNNYTIGVQQLNDPEVMIQLLDATIRTAKNNGDLMIESNRHRIGEYVDGLRLVQVTPGIQGNSPYYGTMLTGQTRFLKTVNEVITTRYETNANGQLVGPINEYTYDLHPEGNNFTGGDAGVVEHVEIIELMAENPGIVGNSISLTGDGTRTVRELADTWNQTNTSNQLKVIQGGSVIPGSQEQLHLTGGTETHDFNFRAGTIKEAYTNYVNPGFDNYDYDNGFSKYGTFDDMQFSQGSVVDGSDFLTGVCAEEDAEFVYTTDDTIPLYEEVLPVGQTEYSNVTQEDLDSVNELTLYEQNVSPTGTVSFRSYNNSKIEKLSGSIDRLIREFSLFENSDFDNFRDEFNNGMVRYCQVYVDVVYIETKSFILLMKTNFNTMTSEMEASTQPIIMVRITDEGNTLSPSGFQPYYIESEHKLLFGIMSQFESESKQYTYPRLFQSDLNTMQFHQVFPNKDYPESEKNYILTGDLKEYQIESVDRPIISYNDIIDMYTLSYSCKLSGGDQVVHGVCINDFEYRAFNIRMTDNYIYHTTPATRYVKPTPAWVPEVKSKSIKLWPDKSLIPFDDDITHTMSLSSMESHLLSAYELDLDIECKTIPTSSGAGYRVNRLIFDPGDGTEKEVVNRVIASGLEALDFDVSELPDQSDLYDPRRIGFSHKYRFSDFTKSTTTASVTAVFSNFKKLIYNINLETAPFTVESGFGDIKLIDTKVYMTDDSKCKQLLYLESQNPRYTSHVVIDRDKYTNANVVGYVNGARYAGPWHTMSNGTLMTGEEHTPASQVITLTRDESLNLTTAEYVNEVPTLFNNLDPTYTGITSTTNTNNAGY